MKEPQLADAETQRLRDQLQRLKGELMRTGRAHEEELTRAEAEAGSRVAALERELSAARRAAQAVQSELTHAQAEAADRQEAGSAAEAQTTELRAQLDNAVPTENGDVSGHTHHAEDATHQTHAHKALAAEAQQLRRELDTLRTEHAAVVASLGTTERLAREKQQEFLVHLRDSEARCAELQTGLDNSEQGKEAQLVDLTREASALAQRLQHAEATAQAARAELDAERVMHASAAEELARLRQATAQQDQVQRLQVELDRALADLEGFGELHDATVAEVDDLRTQLEARTAASEAAAQQSAELQRLQLELDRALADLEGFGELHDATVAEVHDLRAQLGARTAEAESAAQELSQLRSASATSSARRGAADRELAELRAQAERHQQAAAVAEAELSRLQEQLEATDAALAERDAFWQAELASARAANEQVVRELRQRASELEAEFAASSHSQSELAQAKAALSGLHSANASLQSQLDQATASSPLAADPSGQVAALQRLLAESQARVAELQAQLEDLRQRPQPSSSQPDAAERGGRAGDQAAVLRAELEALRQAADAAVLERDRLRAQLSRSGPDSTSCENAYAIASHGKLLTLIGAQSACGCSACYPLRPF